MPNQNKSPKGVVLDHISKIYKDPKTGKEFYAVHDVTLDIAPGSFVTLLGPPAAEKPPLSAWCPGWRGPRAA